MHVHMQTSGVNYVHKTDFNTRFLFIYWVRICSLPSRRLYVYSYFRLIMLLHINERRQCLARFRFIIQTERKILKEKMEIICVDKMKTAFFAWLRRITDMSTVYAVRFTCSLLKLIDLHSASQYNKIIIMSTSYSIYANCQIDILANYRQASAVPYKCVIIKTSCMSCHII